MWSEEAPSLVARVRAPTEDAFEAKRRLLAAIDDLRGVAPDRLPEPEPGAARIGGGDEADDLRRRLEEAEGARRALEEEVRVLERRALAAIAEAGRLRRALDETAVSRDHDRQETRWRAESREIRLGLEAAHLERSLLTSALSDSESELARMARTIDLMARKLDVAS